MNKGYITDIFWDRIYLNIVIEVNSLKTKEIYLFLGKKIFETIELQTISENKYKAIINITNIKNEKMLQNGSYSIKIMCENGYQDLFITTNLGYKLEKLDKIYRYKKYYAYTINFEVKKLGKYKNGELSCILKSRFMVDENIPFKIKTKKQIAKCGKRVFNFMFKVFDMLHSNKTNKILLMSETRAPISGNLKVLDERIKERGIDKKYKISYFFDKTLETKKLKLLFKWIKLSWIISKQEKIFIDDYSPIFKYIDLSNKTKLIQVWHAGVGFKSVGYARFGFAGPEPYDSCHRKYDYAIVGAKGLIPVYSEVFGIDESKILPYGLPRLDNFLDANKIDKVKEKLYLDYPILNNKKVILFAPTFRGKGQKKAYYPFEKIDLKSIYELCNKQDYVFVIKMHPFIKEHIEIPEKYKDRIFDFSDYKDINELFYITDILITDYSSNIYDFSLLNKPILFYTFDLEEYELMNKVHRPITEYAPGKICNTFEETLKAIKDNDFEIEKLEKYKMENFDVQEKKATDLIIDNLILKGENND